MRTNTSSLGVCFNQRRRARLAADLGDPDGSAFEVNLDTTRRDAANDDAPERGIVLTGTVRW